MSIYFYRISIAIVFVFGLSLQSEAQFIHYTHMKMNPLMLNPGNTGAFYGTFRINGIFRDQDWRTATAGQEYQMINGSVDININGVALKKEDWLSVGINFGRQGITTNFVRQEMYPSIAYHLVLDKKTMSDLAIGFSVGSITNIASQNGDYITRHGLVTNFLSDGQDLFQAAQDGKINSSATDYSLGVVLTTPAGKYADFKIGLSMRQPFKPRVGLENTIRDVLAREFNAFLFYNTEINDRLIWSPGFTVSVEKSSNYLNAQTNFSYHLNPDKDIWLNAGIGARIANRKSLQFLLGSDFGDTTVGLAFDLHFGAAAGSLAGGAGAMELAVSKIIKIHKKPEPEPIMLCPRL